MQHEHTRDPASACVEQYQGASESMERYGANTGARDAVLEAGHHEETVRVRRARTPLGCVRQVPNGAVMYVDSDDVRQVCAKSGDPDSLYFFGMSAQCRGLR